MSFSNNPFLQYAAVLGHARRRLQNREEEERAGYSNDNNVYEYKIIRSFGPIFSKKEDLEKVLSEEKENGWEMVEMFDSCRIRLRRKNSMRNNVSSSSIDPYRNYIKYTAYDQTINIIAIFPY